VNFQNDSFSDVDKYFDDGSKITMFTSSTLPFRIINPYKYVRSTAVTISIIIDLSNYVNLPIKELIIKTTS